MLCAGGIVERLSMFTEGLATSLDDRYKAAEFGDSASAVGLFPQTVACIRAQVIHRP